MIREKAAPTTMEQLSADPEYMHYLSWAIGKLTRGAMSEEDCEDLRQQVLLAILERDLLRRYDPKRSGFSSYLYLIARSVVNHAFVAAKRRAKRFSSVELVEQSREDPTGDRLVLETFRALTTDADTRRVEATLLADALEQRLAQTADATAPVYIVDGRRCPQNRLGVFRLARMGCNAAEIAEQLGTTRKWVEGMLRLVQDEGRVLFEIAA